MNTHTCVATIYLCCRYN